MISKLWRFGRYFFGRFLPISTEPVTVHAPERVVAVSGGVHTSISTSGSVHTVVSVHD